MKGSVSRIKNPDTEVSSLVLSEPKTKAGRRNVPILDNLAPVLEAHKARQDAERKEAGSTSYAYPLFFAIVGKVFSRKKGKKNPAKPYTVRVFDGALKQIRTVDLVLTKDALCRLSYESILLGEFVPQF